MLPLSERLKDRYTFNLIFKKKNKLTSSHFILYYLLHNNKDINKLNNALLMPKVAFVVGVKIDKRATVRNSIKRRMREAYRLIRKKYIDLKKVNIRALVWIATPSMKNATFEEAKNSMESMLRKLRQ